MRDGLLLIDKHGGCTSHDIVAAARRIVRLKKIGHCGTLDPAATGLLLLTLGRATRLTRFLIRAPKVYEGTVRFGIATDTYDTSGQVAESRDTGELSAETVSAAMEGFLGTYGQTPPPYCAKKIGGVRYYELARRGEKVPDDKKEVTIFDFRPLADWQRSEDLRFLLSCSSGTYARSMAHELGEKLGCGAALASLRRTRIGPFDIGDAITLDALRERLADGATDPPDDSWIPFDEIPLPFVEVTADVQQEQRILHGQSVLVRDLTGSEGDWVKLLNQRRQFIAVGSVVERIGEGSVGVIQPKVVFNK